MNVYIFIIYFFVTLKLSGQDPIKVTTFSPTTSTKFVISRQLYGNYTPHTPSYPIKDRKTKFEFEGVDYDLMPPDMHEKNNDCRAQFITCIRYSTVISPVCGYDWYSWYFHDYHTPCEIELENCLYRLKYNYGMYGTHYLNNLVYYNGEGHDCKYYVRMGGNMMDAYFGGNARRNSKLNTYYRLIRNLPYRVGVTDEDG